MKYGRDEPTVAEEHYARLIAFWHGATMVVNNQTKAARAGYGSFGDSPGRYADGHWQEYLGAARAVISRI